MNNQTAIPYIKYHIPGTNLLGKFAEDYMRNEINYIIQKIEEIYENVHDLKAVYPVRTEDELNTLLDDHFFCGENKVETKREVAKTKVVVEDDEDLDDEIPMDFESKSDEDVSDEVDVLLEDLED